MYFHLKSCSHRKLSVFSTVFTLKNWASCDCSDANWDYHLKSLKFHCVLSLPFRWSTVWPLKKFTIQKVYYRKVYERVYHPFTLPMLYYSEGFQKLYRSTLSLRCSKHPPEQFNSAKCVSNPITANHKKDNQQKCFPFAATESVEQISDQSGNVCLDCQTGLPNRRKAIHRNLTESDPTRPSKRSSFLCTFRLL